MKTDRDSAHRLHPARVSVLVPGIEHWPGVCPCEGSYCALDAWHGRCFTGHQPSPNGGWESCGQVQWSCWQESCVKAWAERHDGCHVTVSQGLTP